MSKDPKEEHGRKPAEKPETPTAADVPSALRRRALPKGATMPGPRSGWIILLVIAAAFLAMRLMNPNKPAIRELSQTEFRQLVEEAPKSLEVKRVRALESGSTYIAWLEGLTPLVE